MSGTSVTKKSLSLLLTSKYIGTRRDLPQFSARYERPSSELYVNVQGSKAEKAQQEFLKPVGPFKFQYGRHLGEKLGESSDGIKWLQFKEKEHFSGGATSESLYPELPDDE